MEEKILFMLSDIYFIFEQKMYLYTQVIDEAYGQSTEQSVRKIEK
jgi:hypothetical protein